MTLSRVPGHLAALLYGQLEQCHQWMAGKPRPVNPSLLRCGEAVKGYLGSELFAGMHIVLRPRGLRAPFSRGIASHIKRVLIRE